MPPLFAESVKTPEEISNTEEFRIDIDSTAIFNDRLKDSDKEILSTGGVLLRSVSSMKKLCVNNAGYPSLVITPIYS